MPAAATTSDVASFHGAHVDFADVTSWPKPVQRPHPPVLVGGNGPHVARRVVDDGDGWIPMRRPGLISRIDDFVRTVRKPGREEPLPVTVFDGHLDEVEGYAAAGVERVLFWIRPTATTKMTRLVDEFALGLGPRLR